MSKYCVYLTTYSGNKLPMFYIGSTSIKKIEQGYRGSVSSKQYKSIWIQELKFNPHLFKTKIVCIFDTRKEAISKEGILQRNLQVVKSPLYINKAFVAHNGFFGMDVKGSNNPNFGHRHTEETKKKMSDARKKQKGHYKHSEETKRRMSQSGKGRIVSVETLENMSKCQLGKTLSQDTKDKMSKSKSGSGNPQYGKTGESSPNFGTKWYTDGIKNIKSKTHPGENWYPGRIMT